MLWFICIWEEVRSVFVRSIRIPVRLNVFAGTDWRRPDTVPLGNSSSDLEAAAGYATYVRILSWFLDDPSALCPFSVHRMALVGKQLGKEIGEWFGPSTAAGALK
jgi:cysteine protease ATG4